MTKAKFQPLSKDLLGKAEKLWVALVGPCAGSLLGPLEAAHKSTRWDWALI